MLNIFFFSVLLILSSNAKVPETKDESGNIAYGNTKHPFGDESQYNTNALDSDINQVHCVEQKDIKELEGNCPLKEGTGAVADPYIACPGYDVIPPPHEAIYSSSERPSPEVQCKRCDLRLTTDSTAVIVECFQCFDIPSNTREAHRTEKSILYKVFNVQISNYTSVEVTGNEYF